MPRPKKLEGALGIMEKLITDALNDYPRTTEARKTEIMNELCRALKYHANKVDDQDKRLSSVQDLELLRTIKRT